MSDSKAELTRQLHTAPLYNCGTVKVPASALGVNTRMNVPTMSTRVLAQAHSLDLSANIVIVASCLLALFASDLIISS